MLYLNKVHIFVSYLQAFPSPYHSDNFLVLLQRLTFPEALYKYCFPGLEKLHCADMWVGAVGDSQASRAVCLATPHYFQL